MAKIFVVFKKQSWEKVNAYSLVDKETFGTLPVDIVHKSQEVEDKLYTKEELEKLRDENV